MSSFTAALNDCGYMASVILFFGLVPSMLRKALAATMPQPAVLRAQATRTSDDTCSSRA